MASPAIRAYQIARELARTDDVTLVSPAEPDGQLDKIAFRREPDGSRAAARALRGFDAVVAQKLRPPVMRALAASPTRVVYDLYTPALPEGLAALAAGAHDGVAPLLLRAEALSQQLALAAGDAFVCTTERQRDFWLGMLGFVGRLDPAAVREDRMLRGLIDVVPFGVPAEPPAAKGRALKGVIPGIGAEDRVLLWAGGITDWTDAETVIRAVATLARRRTDVKLFFLGTAKVPRTPTEARARELASSLGVAGTSVFFGDAWVPYDERQNYLLEADLGVAAYLETLEARFAFRARLLDYVWALLPIVTTRGDTLGNLVAERGLGKAVAPGDSEAFAAAVEFLLDDAEATERAGLQLERVREELAWPRVVEPLRRLLQDSAAPASRAAARARLEDAALRARISYRFRGGTGMLRRQAGKLGRR